MAVVPMKSEEVRYNWRELLQEARQIADRIDRGEQKTISHEELKRLILEKLSLGTAAHKV